MDRLEGRIAAFDIQAHCVYDGLGAGGGGGDGRGIPYVRGDRVNVLSRRVLLSGPFRMPYGDPDRDALIVKGFDDLASQEARASEDGYKSCRHLNPDRRFPQEQPSRKFVSFRRKER